MLAPAPLPPARILAYDAIRGAAILGTLGTNIFVFAMVGVRFDPSDMETGLVDGLVLLLTNGKFLSLLCLLFGVGLAMLHERALERGERWPGPYVRRNLLLLLIGLVHYVLVFEYDVLTGYAVAAIATALIVARSPRVQRWAFIIAASTYAIGTLLLTLFMGVGLLIPSSHDSGMSLLEAYFARIALLPDGSYAEQVAYRVRDIASPLIGVVYGLPQAVMLMLAGVWVHRSRLLIAGPATRQRRARLAWLCAGGGLALSALALLPLGPTYALISSTLQRYALGPVVAIGYACALSLWLDRTHSTPTPGGAGVSGWMQRRLSDVGKTALSCYVGQNVLASAIFYRWGWGLADAVVFDIQSYSLGMLVCVLAMVLIWAMLLIMAHAWLGFFAAGPVELAWRWLAGAVERVFSTRAPRA